jgi:hypothetical protein
MMNDGTGLFGGSNLTKKPTESPRRGGGGMFGGGKGGPNTRDIIGMILGTLGDGLAINNGGQATTAPYMMHRFEQQRAQQDAEQERNRTEKNEYRQGQEQGQAAAGLGYTPEQIRGMQAGVTMPDAPTPGSFGWYQGASEAERAQYDEYNPVTVATGQGPVRVPRNRPAIGSTIRLGGQGGAQQPQPVTQGAPQRIGAQATRVGSSQLNALVTQYGPQEVERMIRSGQIVIGN